jgi:hypothetical protein
VENALIDRLTYHPDGSTALYDATGKTLLELMEKVRHSEQSYLVYVVIVTDGEENASKFFTLPMIRNLIQQSQKEFQFEFIFLGANFNVQEVGKELNIPDQNVKEFQANEAGVKKMFNELTQSINFATDLKLNPFRKRRGKSSK